MRPRTLASTRSEPAWRTIRRSATGRPCASPRPSGRRTARSSPGSTWPRRRRARMRSSAPRSAASLGGDEPVGRGRSPRSRRTLLGDEEDEVADELVGVAEDLAEHARLRRGSSSGFASSCAARARRRSRPRSRRAPGGRRRACPAPLQPGRATARTCGGRRPLARCSSSAEKSSSPIASSIRLRWSSRSSTLPATFRRHERRARRPRSGSARAPGPSRPRSACASPRAAAAGRPRSPHGRARAAIGDLAGLGEDLARLALRLGDELLVLLEQLPGLGPRVLGLLDGGADALAPLVDRLLDRPEREVPQDEEGDRKADERPDHQTWDDVDQR